MFIPKKDGGLRACMDYRRLSHIMVKDSVAGQGGVPKGTIVAVAVEVETHWQQTHITYRNDHIMLAK